MGITSITELRLSRLVSLGHSNKNVRLHLELKMRGLREDEEDDGERVGRKKLSYLATS